MRILITTQTVDKNDPALGFFHEWIAEFSRAFDSVTVVCLKEGVHELPANVRVLSLGKEKGSSRLGYVARFYHHVIARLDDYDGVFVHMNPEYVALGGLLWRMLGKKVVLWYLHKSVDLKLRVAERLAHAIATGSAESFRLESDKVHVLGHGIDTELFSPGAERPAGGPLSVVTVGRISPSKDYETLIEAIALSRDAILSIVGAPATEADREYETRLRRFVSEHGLSGRVRFEGSTSHGEVPDVLRAADVFVNMSKTGSLDKAVLEAMACGLPAVSSNEAFANMLRPFGLTFSEGNASALATVLDRLSADRQGLRSLGARLRDIVVTHHGLPRLVGAIKELYE